MPNDIEERLRSSLRAHAQRVEVDPQTYSRVQRRIRRREIGRWSLAGVSAVAALAAAVIIVPSLPRSDVEIAPGDPGPGDPVAEEPTLRLEAGSPLDACGSLEAVAVVQVTDGGLGGQCVGGQGWLNGNLVDGVPAYSPDGTAVVYAQPDGTLRLQMLVTTDTVDFGGGSLPAFAPDGRFARLMDAGEGSAPLLWVSADVFDEPDAELELLHDGLPTVRTLAWDTVDDHVLYDTVSEDALVHLWAVRPSDGPDAQAVLLAGEHTAFAAPAVASDGTIGALALGGVGFGGWERDGLRLVTLDRGMLSGGAERVTTIADLGGIEGFDADSDQVWLSSAGYLALAYPEGRPRWTPADHPGWLVGDGHGAWFVGPDGEAVPLPAVDGGYRAVVANPSVSFAGIDDAPGAREPLVLEPLDGLPEAAEVTRQRLYTAASAREWLGLETLMAADFTAPGFEQVPPDVAREALQHAAAEEDVLGTLARMLVGPAGIRDHDDGWAVVWPRAFVRDPADWDDEDLAELRAIATEDEIASWRAAGAYLGWRVGLDAEGRWVGMVAGD